MSSATPSRPLRLLMIGPRTVTDDGSPTPIGGMIVLFEELLAGVQAAEGVQVRVINASNRPGWWPRFRWTIRTIAQLLWLAPRQNVVSLHVTFGRKLVLSPVVWLICTLCRVPWLVHTSGGRHVANYEALPGPVRWSYRRTELRASAVLFETRASVEHFQRLGFRNVLWLANFRRLKHEPPVELEPRPARRFVFLSQVRPAKGVPTLLTAVQALADDLTLDVYGPCMEGVTPDDFVGTRANYCGEITPAEAAATLARYDVLVFPTQHHGEGYPGAILEAFAAGIPVIASRWRSIPEIVDDTCGIFIEPGNAADLGRAIEELARSAEKMTTLRAGARRQAHSLSAQRWVPRYLDILRQIARREPPGPPFPEDEARLVSRRTAD